jgi:peptide/nickel transport system permease protein
MTAYVIRRVLWGLVLLIIVSALTFLLFRIIPTGNPAVLRAGRDPQPHLIKEIERVLGLGKPLPVQFWDYLKQIFLHFNFGYSYYSQESVTALIRERLPATLSLTIGAAILWVVAGFSIGVISALKRQSWLDRGSMGGALVVLSAPEFWLGLIFLFLFAKDIGKFKILPGSGTYVGLTSDPGKWFTSLIMPWIVLAAGSAAVFARLVRGSLIETMGEDYIRTARAKGLPEKAVVRQGVRAAINPAVTLFALEIGVLMGGAVLVETVFNIPGIGRLSYDAITSSDFSVIQGTVLLASMFIIVANIVADIAYAYLDPRVKLGSSAR